ncbi:hypothetical protein [Bythopirellula goksoeyrii]|uniref:Uncharacterized protein n=1 Tax=Bythopirellula goksoeyrii TaxID=1400387 RepID=A0A5B9Q7T8_9BACT|nr:hypothetical protein [Bythopirellula goksoeyrii]QEG35104.1 hypothetical protein Pr1d_23950 [Bythopirellula goksoeyrii]
MSEYDDIRTKIEELGGAPGPAGVGSINLNGGTEIKIKYDVPGPGTKVVSIVPYLAGSDQSPSASPPPIGNQRLLAWQYKPDTGPPPHAPPGWRCFKVKLIVDILPGPWPRPDPADLPTLDPDRQNCVQTW